MMTAKPRLRSLPDRNEKARFRIRPLRAALTTSREVHSEVLPLRRTIAFAGGNDAVCPKNKKGVTNAQEITRGHCDSSRGIRRVSRRRRASQSRLQRRQSEQD